MDIGVGIGVAGARTGSFSWSSYWTTHFPTNPVVIWIDDYAYVTWTIGGTKGQYEIWESINGGAYTLVATTAEGVSTYNNYTNQNASVNIKIRGVGGGEYSAFTSVVNIVTPLVFKADEDPLDQISTVLSVEAGKTVYIDWGDGTALTEVTGTETNTHDYVATGQYFVKFSGDTNYLYQIQLYNQANLYGDLGKWILPSLITSWGSIYLWGCGFTGDISNWIINTKLTVCNLYNCHFSGKIPTLSGGAGGLQYKLYGNYLTGTNITVFRAGMTIFDMKNQNAWFSTAELDELLLAAANWFQVNAPTANCTYDFSGDNFGTPTGADLNADIVRIKSYYVAAGKTATININNPLRFNTPKLVLTWDGDVAWCKAAFTFLKAQGIKGTLYVTSGNVGAAGMFTWADVQAILADGFDVQCHGQTHTSFTVLSDAALALELQAVDTAFTANGIPSPANHCAYPSGAINAGKVLVVDDYRQTGRIFIQFPDDNYNVYENPTVYKCYTDVDKYWIPSIHIENQAGDGHFFTNAIRTILEAHANKKQAVITTSHGFSVDGAHGSVMQEDLQYVIDYATTLGYDIITITEFKALLT